MASIRIFTELQHAVRPRFNAPHQLCLTRTIHQTPVALKKKKVTASDDLFNDDSEDSFFPGGDDLFDGGKAQSGSGAAGSKSRKLNTEDRLARFTELRQFVGDRIGLKPIASKEQVRKTAWQHLFSLATTKEQLEQVTELFPKWRDSRRPFTPRIEETFVRRCEELHCPELALKVFGDHSKYGFDLTSPKAARHLLHALHVEHSINDTITLAALYRVYNLPPISSDLVACAMLASACFKHNTPQSITVAKALVPSLKELLEKTDPKEMALPTNPKERSQVKENAWLAWTLTKIEKALVKQKQPFDWLRTWREQSGHTQLTA